MSDPNIPPLPEPDVRVWQSDGSDYTDAWSEESLQSYGLLCLRQGWKMGALACVTECGKREESFWESYRERADSYREGRADGAASCGAACERLVNSSDSPK